MIKGGVHFLFTVFFLLTLPPSASALSTLHDAAVHVYLLFIGVLYTILLLLHLSIAHFTSGKRILSTKHDHLMIVTFALSLPLLLPLLYFHYPLSVPFLPASLLLLGVSLYIKFVTDQQEAWPHFWHLLTLFFGYLSYLMHFMLAYFNTSFAQRFNSLFHPSLAQLSLKIVGASLGLFLLFLFLHAVRFIFRTYHQSDDHPHSLFFRVFTAVLVIILFLLIFWHVLRTFTLYRPFLV